MQIRKLVGTVLTLLGVSVGVLSGAGAAIAVPGTTALTVSTSQSTFVRSAPTPVFSATIAPPVSGWNADRDQLGMQVMAGLNTYWSWPSTCPNITASLGPLADCGISDVKLNGVSNAATVFQNQSQSRIIILLNYSSNLNPPIAMGSNTVVTIDFLPGALTTGSNSTAQFYGYAYTGLTPPHGTLPNGYTGGGDLGTFTVNTRPLATVTFNANDGSGSTTTQSGIVAASLTPNSFVRTNCSFGGWAANVADATAGTVAYADGAQYAFLGSTTLYAIWTGPCVNSGSGSSGGSSSSTGTASTLAATGVPAGALGVIATLLVAAGLIVRRRRPASISAD